MINKAKRYWKELVGLIVLISIIMLPETFLVYNLDLGFNLIKVVGGLWLARVAKSAYDTWQSTADKNKSVSVSRFMSETDNELAKGIVHAAQIITIGVIIAVALSS